MVHTSSTAALGGGPARHHRGLASLKGKVRGHAVRGSLSCWVTPHPPPPLAAVPLPLQGKERGLAVRGIALLLVYTSSTVARGGPGSALLAGYTSSTAAPGGGPARHHRGLASLKGKERGQAVRQGTTGALPPSRGRCVGVFTQGEGARVRRYHHQLPLSWSLASLGL